MTKTGYEYLTSYTSQKSRAYELKIFEIIITNWTSYRLISGYKKIKFIYEQNTRPIILFTDFLSIRKSFIQQVESLFPTDSMPT